MALITITKSRFPLFHGPFDVKFSNIYVDGNTIKVETIAQYLARVITVYRMPGVMVTILTPKEGYTSLGTYPADSFKTIVSNFDIKYYTFIDGLADANFKEVEFGFTYVAFASDNAGTDFSLTPAEGLNYIAILQSNNKIPTPVVGDFDGLWFTIGYTLPPATNTTLGGIIVGSGLTITPEGVLSSNESLYKGTWNANTNTPIITNGVGTFGWWYWVTVGGTWNGITFNEGDIVIYNGSIWEKVSGGTYVLPIASPTVLGGVKIGSGIDISVDGVISSNVSISAGDGMDFTTISGVGAVTLGLPSTIDSNTLNALTAHSHTHKLGNITTTNIVDGTPVVYGALYNSYAAYDSRNITSEGWKIPSESDWNLLTSTVTGGPVYGNGGDINAASDKLREEGTTYWIGENGATNNFGFNGRGSGYRSYQTGAFSQMKTTVKYITSDHVYGTIRALTYNTEYLGYTTFREKDGVTLRLIKTSTTLTNGQTGTYIGNDGKVYPTICIGTQEWLACDLNETKYRNGDWIHGFDGGVYTPIANATWAALTSEGMCYYSDDINNGGGITQFTTIINNLQTQIDAIPDQVQSDWAQTNTSAVDYIKNKFSVYNVTPGSSKIALGGTPNGSVLSPFSIDVNEGNLTLNNIGGTLSISKGGTGLSSLGTALQLLRVNVGATGLEYFTPTYISDAPSNGSLYGRINGNWGLISDTSYTHPTQTAIDTGLLSGANVVSRIIVNTLGHTTSVSTRALALSDLGYTGATDADKYASWIFRALDSGGSVVGTPTSITSGAYASIKAGTNITLSSSGGVITINSSAGTSYGSGTGITISGGNINHSNAVVAGTASEGGITRVLAFGGTFNIPSVTYDAQGHITSKGSVTLTLPANPVVTYTLDGSSTVANSIYLELISSLGGTDNINIIGTGYTTVSWDEVNQKITINSTDRDTNLGNTPGASSVQITSSTGTATTLPAANGSTAGVLSAADWILLHSLTSDTYGYWNIGVNGSYNQVTSAESVNFTYSGMSTIGRSDVGGVTTISVSTPDAPDLVYVYGRVAGAWIAMNGAISSLLTSNLSANKALYSDASGKITASSTVSDTELGYLDGVTSGIQGQINGKAALNGSTSQYFQVSQLEYPGTNRWITKGTSGGVYELLYFTSPSTYDQKMYVDTSGNLKATSLLLPGTNCNVNSSGGYMRIVNGSYSLSVDSSGNGVFDGTVTATNFILTSDRRLKENIKTIDTSHKEIEFIEFNMKGSNEKRYGVIAQQVEEVAPELVRTNEDGMKSVAYIDLLISKIAELEARIKILENA